MISDAREEPETLKKRVSNGFIDVADGLVLDTLLTLWFETIEVKLWQAKRRYRAEECWKTSWSAISRRERVRSGGASRAIRAGDLGQACSKRNKKQGLKRLHTCLSSSSELAMERR
jgi:hypothetical protein